jgi:plastocyanin
MIVVLLGGCSSGEKRPGDGPAMETDSGLDCPALTDYVRETPEEGAVAQACYEANDLEGIPFDPLRVEVNNETAQTATVRVVGYSETCEQWCPGEIEKTYELFIDGEGSWRTETSFSPFEEAAERAAVREQELRDKLNAVQLTVSPNNPPLREGDFCATVQLSETLPGLWYKLLVDLPNGQTDIIYRGRGPDWVGSEDCFSDLPGDDGLFLLPFDIYRWNGDAVSIKAYQLTLSDPSFDIEGAWVMLEGSSPPTTAIEIELDDNVLRLAGDPEENPTIVVSSGMTVPVRNVGRALHNLHVSPYATSVCGTDDPSPCTDPPRITGGGEGSITFDVPPGTYEYRCDFHASETTGILIVEP